MPTTAAVMAVLAAGESSTIPVNKFTLFGLVGMLALIYRQLRQNGENSQPDPRKFLSYPNQHRARRSRSVWRTAPARSVEEAIKAYLLYEGDDTWDAMRCEPDTTGLLIKDGYGDNHDNVREVHIRVGFTGLVEVADPEYYDSLWRDWDADFYDRWRLKKHKKSGHLSGRMKKETSTPVAGMDPGDDPGQ